MKVNTDGVLLGALAHAESPVNVLDIGTGTGVIALMLAQRFTNAIIDAVEIDESAAQTTTGNFNHSKFADRLTVYAESFQNFSERFPEKKYDLIVSNPPFYIHSLKSPAKNEALAKHTDELFFEELVIAVSSHVTEQGACCLILPLQTAHLVKKLIANNQMYLHQIISLHSFEESTAHREVLFFGHRQEKPIEEKFVIYSQPNIYSPAYREVLKDFLTIF